MPREGEEALGHYSLLFMGDPSPGSHSSTSAPSNDTRGDRAWVLQCLAVPRGCGRCIVLTPANTSSACRIIASLDRPASLAVLCVTDLALPLQQASGPPCITLASQEASEGAGVLNVRPFLWMILNGAVYTPKVIADSNRKWRVSESLEVTKSKRGNWHPGSGRPCT